MQAEGHRFDPDKLHQDHLSFKTKTRPSSTYRVFDRLIFRRNPRKAPARVWGTKIDIVKRDTISVAGDPA